MLAGVLLAALATPAWAHSGVSRYGGLRWSPALFETAARPPWLAPGGAVVRTWWWRRPALAAAVGQAGAPPGQAGKTAAQHGQAKHIFFIIPAYNVEYIKNVPPLTPHEKLVEMWQGVYDYDGLAMSAAETLFEHDRTGFCGYGHGWGGFGKCYASALADADDSSFLGDYLFPVWWHQDPRYFPLGDGYSIPSRIWYSLTRVFIAKSDHGGWTFASAATAGTIIAAVASNLYYPKSDRGVGLTSSRIAWDLGGTAIFNLEAEFWQDIHRKIFGH